MSESEIHPIAPEKMAAYRATAQRRAEESRQQLLDRHGQARQVADRGAALLKTRYGASSVLVFGSLLDERLFHARSDIDLAAWGLDWRVYLRALSDLQGLDPEFEVDLIRMEEARPGLRNHIEQSGQEL